LIFLMDTNILSEARKQRLHGGVLAWFAAYPNESFAIPSVAVFELQMGTEKLRDQDPARAARFATPDFERFAVPLVNPFLHPKG
jgi:predicted nucleic acid-binding protein